MIIKLFDKYLNSFVWSIINSELNIDLFVSLAALAGTI
jgi:hypothetical protein